MPFIKQERREAALKGQLPDTQVGDRCYRFYKPMVDAWRKEPRWTTAHSLYKGMLHGLHMSHMANVPCDDCIAAQLAWQVFFMKFVWPYELEKEKENGEI